MARRPAFSPVVFLVVVVGGAIGVALRALIVVPLAGLPDQLLVPLVTLGVNVVGSLLLGIVVGWLDDRRPRLRAFLGTGILGGFTTYSAFSVQVVQLTGQAPVVGVLLAAVSIFAGVLAAAAGLRVGRTIMDVPGEVEPPEAAE
ncbi:fluoride efflux transporter FluC [Microbacterium sp. B2969]|uniref:Fluoride-specific ion channel FluC n=1 Tax=Microbacterium alkaliflavum TaxID=3248839 RepID=A0ABW7QDZ3_9MICO